MRNLTIVQRVIATAAMVIAEITIASAGFAGTNAPSPPPISPIAEKVLTNACGLLSSSHAFSFHADILFDQLLPSAVKVQFGGEMDFVLQRPDQLAVDYESDLGAKRLWYSGGKLTIYDPPHQVFATVEVPDSTEGALQYVAETRNLTIPLSAFAATNPCARIKPQIIYGGYIGVNDVNGRACDHVSFSGKHTDFQLWVDKSGKPIVRKIVINYRSQPGAPEFIAMLSDWKFPATIPVSRFKPQLPKSAHRIEFLQVKAEAQP